MVNMSFTARNLPERHHHWTHSDWLSSPPHIWPPDVGEPLPGVILKYVNRYTACLMYNRYYIYCVYIYILGMSIYRVCIYIYVCMYVCMYVLHIHTYIIYLYSHPERKRQRLNIWVCVKTMVWPSSHINEFVGV